MAKSKNKKAEDTAQNITENGLLRVYSFDKATGEYTGESEAQPSPLEPGVFLIPANATETAPPEAKEGKFRKFNGSDWEYENIPKPKERDEPNAAQIARMRRNALLNDSDWRALSDVPAKHKTAAWTTYRQELRDVPQQAGFPDNINWPNEPK